MLQVKSQSRERERVGTPEEGGGGGVHNNFTVTEAASKGAEVF